jgi:sigma-E factor negative regulatory protein RseB
VRQLSFLSFCCLLGSLLAMPAWAGENVLQLLNRMQEALQSRNYYGTLVYIQDGKVQSMRIVHQVSEKGEYERLVNLNGNAREVIRKDNVVACFIPEQRTVLVGQRRFDDNVLSRMAENDFSAFQEHYDFLFDGEGRVAGLAAQRIMVKPKDNLRYGYRLWVAKDNALLLKFELLNEDGEVLEQSMFADISVVDSVPEELLKPETTSEGFTWFKHEEESENRISAADSGWHISQLPEGFTITAHYKHLLPNSQNMAEHFVVTDGLASISAYIEKIGEGHEDFVGLSPMGAVNAFGKISHGHQITVIGEVPESAVEMIAHGVVYEPKEEAHD